MSISYMTREGFQKLEKELHRLMRGGRREIANKLEIARSHGDLRENAEYDAAKEEQAMLERKIGELSTKLAAARIIDNMDIDPSKAFIGAMVTIKDLKSGEEEKYQLVSDAEADFLENKLSVNSPIGKGLLGHEVDDVVEIQVPAGALKYQILAISR